MKVIDLNTGVKKKVTFDKDHNPIFTAVNGDLNDNKVDVPAEGKEACNELEVPSKGMRLEAWYPELPDLLFGGNKEFSFFNASEFQRKRNVRKDIREFLANTPCVKVYAKKLNTDRLMKFTDNGDVLLHEVLAFAYVEYIDPVFSIYMHDRMHELFYNGMVVSEIYLAVAAKRRLPKSVLEELMK
ncbi:MAG: hypothetical protein PHC95_08985 [Parabacteroides sp.]|nr:hypothetical protein [Parabacteroides sp.]